MALTMNDIYEKLKIEGGRTPSEKVMEVSKDHPEKIALRYKVFGIWQETTYKDFWMKSNYVSMGLRFFGVEKGNSVAIHSENTINVEYRYTYSAKHWLYIPVLWLFVKIQIRGIMIRAIKGIKEQAESADAFIYEQRK